MNNKLYYLIILLYFLLMHYLKLHLYSMIYQSNVLNKFHII